MKTHSNSYLLSTTALGYSFIILYLLMVGRVEAEQASTQSLYGSWSFRFGDLDKFVDTAPRLATYVLFVVPLDNDLQPDECWSYLEKLQPNERAFCLVDPPYHSSDYFGYEAKKMKMAGGNANALARVVLVKKLPDGTLTSFSDLSSGFLLSHSKQNQTSFWIMLGPWGTLIEGEITQGATAKMLENEIEIKFGEQTAKAKAIERLKPLSPAPASIGR